MEWIRDAAIFASGVLAFWAGAMLSRLKSRAEQYNEQTLEQDNIRLRIENNSLIKENNDLRKEINDLKMRMHELEIKIKLIEGKI